MEPLPLEPIVARESPTGVVETTMVPFLEAARGGKRKSSSAAASRGGSRRRSSASAKQAREEESEEDPPSESDREKGDDDDDDDDGGDVPPGGGDDNSGGSDVDGNVIVLGEIRQAAAGGQPGFPGANAQGTRCSGGSGTIVTTKREWRSRGSLAPSSSPIVSGRAFGRSRRDLDAF